MTRLNTTIPEELKITQHWSQPIGLRQGVLVAGLFAFLLSVLTYSENLPFNIVPKLTVLLLLQCAAGGALWQWLSKDDAVSIPLFVGVGLALGSMLIVALDQIFLLLNLGKVSHLLTLASLGLIGMSNLVPRKRRNNHIPHDPTSRQVNHWILVGSTFIALLGASAFRPELLPFSIALSVGVLCAMFGWRTHLRTKSTLIRRVRIERNILMLLSVLFTLVAVVSIIQATSDKPQFFPGGDLAHDESLATSVATWGPGDSIQLVGTPIRYHWLALGWIGYVNKILGFEPFVAARVAMPVLVYLSSVLMLWTSLIRSRRLIPYAVIVPIAGMLSAPVGEFGGVFAGNATPTNQIGMSWALITMFAIIQTYRDRLRLGFLVSAILMFFTTGAKGPYGACLVVATLSLVAATVAKERKIDRQDILLGLGVLFGFLISYLLLIKADGQAGLYRINPELASRSVFRADDLRWFGWYFLEIANHLIPLIALVFFASRYPRSTSRPENYFFYGLIAVSVIAYTTKLTLGAEQYFAVFLAVVVPVMLSMNERLLEEIRAVVANKARILVCCAVAIMAGVLNFSNIVYREAHIQGNQLLPVLAKNLPLIVLSTLLGHTLFRLMLRRRQGRSISRALSVLVFVSLMFGTFIADAARGLAKDTAANLRGWDTTPGQEWDQSQQNLIDGLNWLRIHSHTDDLVATNVVNDNLVSSFTQRRTLVETYGSILLLYQQSRNNGGVMDQMYEDLHQRLIESTTFATNPKIRQMLNLRGVKWFIIDKTLTSDNGWRAYGGVAYENDRVAILALDS